MFLLSLFLLKEKSVVDLIDFLHVSLHCMYLTINRLNHYKLS